VGLANLGSESETCVGSRVRLVGVLISIEKNFYRLPFTPPLSGSPYRSFKIDFEKAYDKVKWSFLQQTLRMKGFSPKWCRWVQGMVSGGSVGIKVNDEIGPCFQTKRGLRQGDPMSPILFNIVADMLALLIRRAKADGKIRGVIPHLVDDGLSILQYADDTVLFLDHDLEQAKNLKLLLCAFEQLSGLKINFHKSEIFKTP
jgi:hypothetical protein